MEYKLRVVWLCHFSNDEIQNILKPRHRVPEFAPWIPIALSTVEKSDMFEIHVVAPFMYIEDNIEFKLRNIHYHFFNPYPLRPKKLFYNRLFNWEYVSDFAYNKRKVKEYIDKIAPDVIHLLGAENPYYSATILPLIPHYPTILTVQGFYSQSAQVLKGQKLKKSILEQKILRSIPISFYEAKKQGEDIKKYNPSIELYWHFWGSYEIKRPKILPKQTFDFVFFARLNKDKGIVDLLEAIKLIKEKKPDVSLCVIGGKKENVFAEYASKIGINDNVTWTGFLPTREDVHAKALEAKISVLPTYSDINPGTIIESMFLGIPVVSYAVDSMPEINENGEVIKLCELGNICELADTMYNLLINETYRRELSNKGILRAKEMYAPTDEYLQDCLYKGYTRAIEIFKNN